jgi:hypothetical protein
LEVQKILKLALVVQIEAVVRNQILEVVKTDSEKVIGVSTARNVCTIQLKGASMGKHSR